MHEVGKGPGEGYYTNFAFNEDFMEKQDKKWSFARRNCKYMFLGFDSFTGKMFLA